VVVVEASEIIITDISSGAEEQYGRRAWQMTIKLKTILIQQLKINNKPSIMKKLLLLAMFAVSIQLVQAQDLKKVQTSYILNKMDDAKTEVDKVMADPKAER
jgi:hypothetical protein